MTGFWAELPPGRVVHLVGASPEAFALALEPLPAGAPAVLTCHATGGRSSARLVTALLDQLERAALDLFPAWLPGAGAIHGPGGAGVAAVRVLAAEKAAGSPHFGPFLADLAAWAIGGRSAAAGRFAPEVRAAGLGRVIADSFDRAAVALLLEVDEVLPADVRAVVAGSEWLAQHGGFAVWLTGTGLRGSDRVSQVRVRLPEPLTAISATEPAVLPATEPAVRPPTERAPLPAAEWTALPAGESAPISVAAPASTLTAEAVTVRLPALAGQPHPASKAEQALEAALAGESWAAGRLWNQTVQPDPLTNPVRVDLIWPAERCAVEIDGAEHRGVLHYEADRRRDVLLQLAGYTVLRFTNGQTLSDIGTVLWQIQQLITIRRQGKDGHAH